MQYPFECTSFAEDVAYASPGGGRGLEGGGERGG